jgi:hypothetical protein
MFWRINKMATPIFSQKQREYNGESVNVRCEVDKKVWQAFKTLVSLKRLDIGDVLSDIVRAWVINFGEVKYICSNCGMMMGKDNCYIIVKNGAYINCCSMRCFDRLCEEIKDEHEREESERLDALSEL